MSFCRGEESHSKRQKSICKEAKDTDRLIHHSHVCTKPFTNNAAPLRAGSDGQEAASCSSMHEESSIRSPGMMMGLYVVVQWHKSQEF